MTYRLKRIQFEGRSVAICLQNLNGPCPLLAITNILSLRGKIVFPLEGGYTKSEDLFRLIAGIISKLSSASSTPTSTPTSSTSCSTSSAVADNESAAIANQKKVVQDALATLPKLQSGIDLNVKFTGVNDFEYTAECSIFDLLGISLTHGWIMDPQREGSAQMLKLSYNQMVEKAVARGTETKTEGTDSLIGLLCWDFLRDTASQLTFVGLENLSTHLRDGQLYVFFRNNHFSTLYKQQGRLFLLVTDEGFADFPQVVWEKLDSISGDTRYVDHMLDLGPPIQQAPAVYHVPVANMQYPVPMAIPLHPQTQSETDEQMARRLNSINLQEQAKEEFVAQRKAERESLQLAMQLQKEEEQQVRIEERRASHSSQRRGSDCAIC